MASKIFFILLFLGLVVVTGTASAVKITLSDITLGKNIKVLVYDSKGNLLGEYNSTDTIVLNSTQDYIFVFKPAPQDWFNNPLNSIKLFEATTPTLLGFVLFFAVIVGCLAVVFKIFW